MWPRKMIIALALCLVVASAVLAQQEKWNELNRQLVKLHQEGKYTEATVIAEKSLEVAEKTFGSDNANVATALNNLAELYRWQGKYSEAEALYKRSLEIMERRLGPDHPDVARFLSNQVQMHKKME